MIEANSSRRRWTDDNVKRWKAALTEVVSVIGMNLVGSESKFVKDVVDTIYNKLDRKQIYIPPNVTGMDTRYKEINSWLIQPEIEFLVIYGMAGSGKSTLAKYILKLNCQCFESHSIVEDIGRKCKNPHEMLGLQEKLCSDISKGKVTKLGTVCQGTAQIEVLLEKTKALVVLDDIVKEHQLEDLLGSSRINKESKIIITTDNDISNWFVAKSKRYREYEMRLLNNTESSELLSLHAFRSKIPKDGYEEHVQQVVRYCEGNPTALEVLGLSLAKKHSIKSWESELRSYEKDFHVDINDVLKRSYDSLPAFEKELFLHIACFFVGKDMDYVVKILEPDYAAESKIKTLTKRCFLYVTQENKLMMHRLLQDMGRSLVDQEGIPAKRSRVWRNKDSYEMLKRKKSSETIEGLALDIRMLTTEDEYLSRQLKELSTKSLQEMDRLKLLQLNFVKLTGSYKDLSEHLRWLCWVGFSETTIHFDIFMGNMVALDLSYSCLKEFEPPMVLGSLKILDLKESHNLLEIRNLDQIPNLETLILLNCVSLFHVCMTIGNLERLAILDMTGCKKLCKSDQIITSGGGFTQEPSFPLPHSLQRLFLSDCMLDCTDLLPLSFNDQEFLQYLNLGNGVFNMLPSYKRLKNLRVLDLRSCNKLRRLTCLPSTLAELYIYHCVSIETITFEFGRFTLQKFGYEGCINLSEIEGLVKLLLIAKLDEAGLGHMIWLKNQNHQMCLVGDYELTKGRSWHPQMLFEINIMSTSLPDIRHPKLTPDYISQSKILSFVIPSCPRSSSLKGLDVTFKYRISGENWTWFVKIGKTNSEDLIYSPKVFGKPASGEVSIWLSYWPIGNSLVDGDEVNVSIVVISGLEVLECGVRLVYTDDEEAHEISENKMGWVEALGSDLSRFQLSKGLYYLCQCDFYKLMEVGRLTPGWLSIVVGDAIDDTEVRGWRMTGRPHQSYQSFEELKTGRCIIFSPETKQAEKDTITEISNSSFVDKTVGFTSSIRVETMKSRNTSEFSDAEMEKQEEKDKIAEITISSFDDKTMGFTSSILGETIESGTSTVLSDAKMKQENYKSAELFKSSFVDETTSFESSTVSGTVNSATMPSFVDPPTNYQYQMSLSPSKKALQVLLLHGSLDISILEAKNLPNIDMFNKKMGKNFCGLPGNKSKITSDLYVSIAIATTVIGRTYAISYSENPVWKQHFNVLVAHHAAEVHFLVKFFDVGNLIGIVAIPVEQIYTGTSIEGFYPLVNQRGIPYENGAGLGLTIQYFSMEKLSLYHNGVGSDPQYYGVPGTYFPLRKGGRVTLYQDAHVQHGSLPDFKLDQGTHFVHGSCWNDIFESISKARHLIYITGGSVWHKVKLVRGVSHNAEYTLGDLLKLKSQEGVRVLLLVWDDPVWRDDLGYKINPLMVNQDVETRRFFKHSSVQVLFDPRMKEKRGRWIKKHEVPTIYAHNQKTVIVDEDAEYGKRRIVAFVGGLDLCVGRYDSPRHKLFRTLHADDFHNPTFKGTIVGCPREPWHDMHSKIDGPAAYDVMTNFEERWLKASNRHGLVNLNTSYEDALLRIEKVPELLGINNQPSFNEKDPEAWHVQIFRSIDSNSVKGFPKEPREATTKNLVCGKNKMIDMSIHSAYLKAIRSAQHYIYIENQYFIGSSYNWSSYKHLGDNNLIPMEIALKIASKIKANERFSVYIVIPMWPQGVPTNYVTQRNLFWQNKTMQMMYKTIHEALVEVGLEGVYLPEDYLNFFCLGNREVIGPNDNLGDGSPGTGNTPPKRARKNRRFMIHVNSKGMIVDDEYIIIGSANINQQSMDGTGDSEIAMGAYQPHHTWATKLANPLGQIYGYRTSLWAKHLGLVDDLFKQPKSIECVTYVRSLSEANWNQFAADDVTEMKGHLMKYPVEVDQRGEVKSLPGHENFPDVGGKIVGSLID